MDGVGGNVNCAGFSSCIFATVTNVDNTINCVINKSCNFLQADNVTKINCQGLYTPTVDTTCEAIVATNVEYVFCGGTNNGNQPVVYGTCSGEFGYNINTNTRGTVGRLVCDGLRSCVAAKTYDVGYVTCDGAYSCYNSYLEGIRNSVTCKGERACADYFTTSGFGFMKITSIDPYNVGINVTCSRDDDDDTVCGYAYKNGYNPTYPNAPYGPRTKFDVGIGGKLKCESTSDTKVACKYILLAPSCENLVDNELSAEKIFLYENFRSPYGDQPYTKYTEQCTDN